MPFSTCTTLLCFGIVVLAPYHSDAYTTQQVKKTYDGVEEVLIEYQEGSAGSKIIIVAPHGGTFAPNDMPDRDYGCWDSAENNCVWSHNCGTKDTNNCVAKTSTDLYTMNIALGLAEKLKGLYNGIRPHVVLTNLKRSKLDPNREVNEATFDDAEIKSYYNAFHSYITTARTTVGTGCVFDIHGHTHPEARVELGYKVTKTRLNAKTAYLGYTSIKSLGSSIGTNWAGLLNGTIGLGYLLTEELKSATDSTVMGTTVVPSVDVPSPGSASYFSGGYDVTEHGSRYSGSVDAIQIESPKPVRNSVQGPEYIEKLAKAIKQFMDLHY